MQIRRIFCKHCDAVKLFYKCKRKRKHVLRCVYCDGKE